MLHTILLIALSGLLPAQGVSEEVAAANLVRRVEPEYPPQARASNVSGLVILEAEINQEGTVTNVVTVSGHPLLTAAAQNAVKQWRFNPAMLRGQPRIVATVRVNVAPELGRINCGPLSSVRLYRTSSEEEQLPDLACDEEVQVLNRALTHVEVRTRDSDHGSPGKRGWVNTMYVAKADTGAPKAAAAIGEAQLDCAKRPTLNITDIPGATTISRLNCGENVSILQIDDAFAKIRTGSGVEGWVLLESLDKH